jgi:hypothetical protein
MYDRSTIARQLRAAACEISAGEWRSFVAGTKSMIRVLIVDLISGGHRVGDKSPKSKLRDQKQKDAAKSKDKARKDAAAPAQIGVSKKK